MYIELFKYVEGDENCENSEYLGYVSLEEDDIYIDVDSEELTQQLEDLFSDPIYTDELGGEKEIEPYTTEFFRYVINVLPEYHVRGRLGEAEDVEELAKKFDGVSETRPDESEENPLEEFPIEITVDNLSEDEGYEEESDLDEESSDEGYRSDRDEYEDDGYGNDGYGKDGYGDDEDFM